MTIQQKESLLHWTYFLALEHDLLECSRFVEFSKKNENSYSIEFAQLLFASSSEVDVIAKNMCKIIKPNQNTDGINNYQPIILERFPKFSKEKVFINRYGLDFKPWEHWRIDNSPYWWQSYNKVKHERNDYFISANLKNVLRSMGALLIITIYYYILEFSKDLDVDLSIRNVTFKLRPESELLTLDGDYYYSHLVV